MPEELNATLTLGDMAGLVSDPMRVAVTAEASPEEKRDVAGTKIEGTALTGADSGCCFGKPEQQPQMMRRGSNRHVNSRSSEREWRLLTGWHSYLACSLATAPGLPSWLRM